ncbi:MAG TPA: cation:proton antiporter [Gemmatimonadaceae bacterium]|nr:cation:proton antiporter [Gemmatimonadaceae bacterium]
MEDFASLLALIGIVIVVSSLLSGAVERTGLPQVAIFLALGAGLGPWGLGLVDVGLDSPALRIIATLALVLVLFSDAISVDIAALRQQRRLALLVLGPGTIIVAALLAGAAHALLALSWAHAAILGAALASTDPVLLRTVLRHRRLPEPTRVALRMESGMNDVVLLPIVVIAMHFAPLGDAGAEASLSRSMVGLFILGPLIGALVGWVGIMALVRIRDGIGVRRDYESLYALGIAFTAFALAERVGGSGFLAAFAAGLVIAVQDLELCDCFLEYGEATAEMFLLLTFVAFGASLLWTGLDVVDGRTLVFAGFALIVRTATLYPVLARAGLERRSRRLIAWLGPRGLSSLLLVLLPVFAGMPGAAGLFTITCLVVLLSVVAHGSGIAIWLRRDTKQERGKRTEEAQSRTALASPSSPVVPDGGPITIEEVRALLDRGDPVQIIDARSDRTWAQDDRIARGAIRLPPNDAVRTAREIGLDRRGSLVVYCA